MKNPHHWLDHSCCLPSPWMSIPKQIFLPQRLSAPSQWLAPPLASQYFVLNQLQDHKFPTEIKFQDLGMCTILSRKTLHLFSVTSLTKWHTIFYPLPLNMTGIWTRTLWKMKIYEGFIFYWHHKKICLKSPNFVGSFEGKSNSPRPIQNSLS